MPSVKYSTDEEELLARMMRVKRGAKMLISEVWLEKLTKNQITDLVFGMESEIDDCTLNGDCIFVFGGTNTVRTEKAVELFNNSRAPYILLTGGDRYGTLNEREVLI